MENKNIEYAQADAKTFFSSGFNCAESSLLSICKALKINSDAVPNIATGFGAGVSRHGSICGALSGAVMAMGLAEGRKDPKDNDTKIKLYEKAAAFLDKFKTEFGTVDCRELTGCNLLSAEGREKFTNEKFHGEVCTKFVEFAVAEGIKALKNK